MHSTSVVIFPSCRCRGVRAGISLNNESSGLTLMCVLFIIFRCLWHRFYELYDSVYKKLSLPAVVAFFSVPTVPVARRRLLCRTTSNTTQRWWLDTFHRVHLFFAIRGCHIALPYDVMRFHILFSFSLISAGSQPVPRRCRHDDSTCTTVEFAVIVGYAFTPPSPSLALPSLDSKWKSYGLTCLTLSSVLSWCFITVLLDSTPPHLNLMKRCDTYTYSTMVLEWSEHFCLDTYKYCCRWLFLYRHFHWIGLGVGWMDGIKCLVVLNSFQFMWKWWWWWWWWWLLCQLTSIFVVQCKSRQKFYEKRCYKRCKTL